MEQDELLIDLLRYILGKGKYSYKFLLKEEKPRHVYQDWKELKGRIDQYLKDNKVEL